MWLEDWNPNSANPEPMPRRFPHQVTAAVMGPPPSWLGQCCGPDYWSLPQTGMMPGLWPSNLGIPPLGGKFPSTAALLRIT
jgi:hypothetical protein